MKQTPSRHSARTRQLLEGPILPGLLRFAAPNVLNFGALIILITFDGFFVGKLGPHALAGASLAFPFLMLMQHMSLGGMGGGVASAVARALGRGHHDRADAIAAHALLLALALGAFFAAAEFAFGEVVLRAMGGQDATLHAARTYANAMFAGIAALWLVNVLGSVVRGSGHMVLPAVVLFGSAALHALISPLLIFGVGPFGGFGIAGAGIGLTSSFAIGALVLIYYLTSAHSLVRLRLTHFTFRPEVLTEILKVGAPAALNTVLTNVGVMLLTTVVATFGTAAVAGFGMGVRVEYILMPLTFVLGTSLVTMVGTNVGAGELARAKRIAWTGGGITAAIAAVIGIGIALFPYAWIGLFTSDAEILEIGARYARIVGPFYAFFTLGLGLYFGFQGGGRLFWPLTASALRLVLAVGGGWAAIHWFGFGLTGFFVAIAVGFVVYGTMIAIALHADAWHSVARRP